MKPPTPGRLKSLGMMGFATLTLGLASILRHDDTMLLFVVAGMAAAVAIYFWKERGPRA